MASKVLTRWLPVAAAAAVLPVTAAAAAGTGAQSHYRVPYSVSAVTWLTHRGENGGAAGDWSRQNFTRTAWVTFRGSAPLSNCGTTSGRCYAYTASFYDWGTFTTVPGRQSPNHGAHPGQLISRRVQGRFHGYGLFMTFFATARPQAGLVPSAVSGNAYHSGLWPVRFFPPSARFAGIDESDYGYYYRGPSGQRWVDGSFNGGGQLAADGNITG